MLVSILIIPDLLILQARFMPVVKEEIFLEWITEQPDQKITNDFYPREERSERASNQIGSSISVHDAKHPIFRM